MWSDGQYGSRSDFSLKRTAGSLHYLCEERGGCPDRATGSIRESPDKENPWQPGGSLGFSRASEPSGETALAPFGFSACSLIKKCIPAKDMKATFALSIVVPNRRDGCPISCCGFPTGKCYTSCHFRAGTGRALELHSFDESYVERLRDGDFRTQEHFVAYFSQLIQLKLRSRLHSAHAIEDVRQETFSRVFSALRSGKIRQPERLGAFVNSMCNNVLLEHYRASSRDSSLEDEEQKDFPSSGIDVVSAIASKQMTEKVREILESMPERDRRLIREVFLEERDKDEVCRDFGVDRDYLRVLLHRAKQSFKTLYLKNMTAPTGNAASVKL